MSQITPGSRPEGALRIRCVFLVHAIESWDALMGVYHAMRADPRFEPIVLSINRKFPGDATYQGEETTSSNLTRLGIPHLRVGMQETPTALAALRAFAPAVIFRQSQWEEDVPPAFRIDQLAFAKICSLPYGTCIVAKFSKNDESVGGVSSLAFNQLYHKRAWRVFCETELTRSFFANFNPGNPEKFVLSGYPKLMRLREARNQKDAWPINHGVRNFRVIWAPHHGLTPEWLGFGVFHEIYNDFLSWAAACFDIEFVLKPHPALFGYAVSSGLMSKEQLETFVQKWCALPNCHIESADYGSLFASSDLMVTDGVSFLVEYPVFEKPLVFLDSGRHVPFNPLGDLAVRAAHTVHSFQGMRAAVETYKNGAAWTLTAERQILIDTLFPVKDDPTKIILESILSGLSAEAH